jgi:acyl-CoA thioesterase I
MARQMVRSLRLLKVALALAITQGGSVATANDVCRIAVLGDSLTTAYGIAIEEGFPAQLERRLREEGYDCAVLDAGVSGDTTAGGLARLDWTLADRPSHVIVELGANDGLRALPPEQMEQNLAAIVRRLRADGVAVLLAGMRAPPNLGRSYGEAFERVFSRVAERYGVPLYPFFLDGVASDPALNQGDGIHPTAAGIEVIVERILPTVTDWLDQADAASKPPAVGG